MTAYKIITRDTDGQSARTFKTLAGAMKRFEEMAGHSLDDAIREQFYNSTVPPTVRAVASVRTVSNYGTVVLFVRIGEAEAEPVAAPVAEEMDCFNKFPGEYEFFGDEDGDSNPPRRYEALPHHCDNGEFDIPF